MPWPGDMATDLFRPKRNPRVFHFTRVIGRIYLGALFRISIEGLGNLPRNTAFVLLVKHRRWEDIPLLGLAIPRPLYYVAKHELFMNPLSRWYMSSMGGIPLNRMRPLESRDSIRSILWVLGEGQGLVIFPEGTYFEDRMGPGRVGLIRMIRSKVTVPFIPVGVKYGQGRGRVPVQIRLGEPVPEGQVADEEGFLDRAMKDIARLSGL